MHADYRPSRAAARIACLTIGLSSILTGCANDSQQLKSLCEGFESSWNILANEAQMNGTDPAFSQKLSETAESWNDLANLGGPSDVTDVIRNASLSLQSAWNTTSQADRHSEATSLHNAAGYVRLQCEKSDNKINLDTLGLPYRPL